MAVAQPRRSPLPDRQVSHDFDAVLTRRVEEWSANRRTFSAVWLRISYNDRNTARSAFDRKRFNLVHVEQGQLRRIPLREHQAVTECVSEKSEKSIGQRILPLLTI